jgi:hypothetical protein
MSLMSSSRCKALRRIICTQPICAHSSELLLQQHLRESQGWRSSACGSHDSCSPKTRSWSDWPASAAFRVRASSSAWSALGNVADIALNDIPIALPVNIAHKLDGNLPAIGMLQRMIVITNFTELLQCLHRRLRTLSIPEYADLPQLLPHEVLSGVTQQRTHKGIDIHHLGRLRVQDQDAVVR